MINIFFNGEVFIHPVYGRKSLGARGAFSVSDVQGGDSRSGADTA